MNAAVRKIDQGIVDADWYLDRIGSVVTVRFFRKLTEASFDRFLAALCRSIDERSEDERWCMLVDAPQAVIVRSSWRKRLAAALDERKGILARTCMAYAIATPSLMVRSILKVVFWMAPPPYPVHIAGSVAEACDAIERHLPDMGSRALQAEYARRLAAVLAAAGER